MSRNYPSFAKSERISQRKDALVPYPQEYDMSDPDQTKAACASAAVRFDLFGRLSERE